LGGKGGKRRDERTNESVDEMDWLRRADDFENGEVDRGEVVARRIGLSPSFGWNVGSKLFFSL
jgi:hypothetical protein